MATITTADGQVIDIGTGQIVGGEAPPVEQGKWEIPGTAMDIARQGSYAFNAALFALPDAGVKAIGKALGLPDDEVVTLTKMFNKGDTGPKNASERYARAIGEAVGANVPLTGVLGYVAKGKALAAPLAADAGIVKRLAKDTLDFIRNNPKAALFADVAGNATFGATRQAVEENMAPGLAKDITKEVLPMATSIAGPAAVLTAKDMLGKLPLPSVLAAKYAKELVKPSELKLTEVGKEIVGEYPWYARWPVSKLVGRAETQVAKGLAKGEIQENLRATQELIDSLGAQGVNLNTAERTLLPNLLREQGTVVRNMKPEQLRAELARRQANMDEFHATIERLSPKSDLELSDALSQIKMKSDDLQQAISDSMATRFNLEQERVAAAFPGADKNVLGSELREMILRNGESQFFNLRNMQEKMGLRMNFTKDGVPLPTRDSSGVSLYQATNIEKPVNEILQKYNILTGPIKEYAPGLVKILGRYKKAQVAKGESAYDAALSSELSDLFMSRQRPGAGAKTPDFLDPQEAARSAAAADRDFLNMQQMNARSLVNEMSEMKKLGINVENQMDSIASRYGLTGDQLRGALANAKATASKAGQVDINFPEAVKLLQVSTESRNNALRNLTDSQLSGKERLAAQANFDKINALHTDIENMLYKAVPKLGAEYKNFKTAYRDVYGEAYEKYLPLLLGAKRPTGEFLTSNEAVLKRAFETGENVKDVSFLLGQSDSGRELMTAATMDWLRGKPIFDKDGLIDPKKLQNVLKTNKNIVDSLPPYLKQSLGDELEAGKAYAARMSQLEARKEAFFDKDLDDLIAKSVRPGADPQALIDRALKDPADMLLLTKALGRDPNRLEALRRAVYKSAADESPNASIEAFLAKANEKSLKYLFSDEQLNNLKQLAILEKHVKASPGIVETPSPFETTNDSMKRILGVSLEGVTGIGKAIAEKRVGTAWSTVYLGMRLIGRQEYSVLDRVMQKAVTDPEFGKALAQSISDRDIAKQMSKIAKKALITGVYIPEAVFKAPFRSALINTAENLEQPVAPQAPTTPQAPAAPSAAQQLKEFKQQPPAPPTRTAPKATPSFGPALPTQAPPQPGQNAAQMYQSLFPNDRIGNLIQMKKQMQGQ